MLRTVLHACLPPGELHCNSKAAALAIRERNGPAVALDDVASDLLRNRDDARLLMSPCAVSAAAGGTRSSVPLQPDRQSQRT
jgi:hypothetical protein